MIHPEIFRFANEKIVDLSKSGELSKLFKQYEPQLKNIGAVFEYKGYSNVMGIYYEVTHNSVVYKTSLRTEIETIIEDTCIKASSYNSHTIVKSRTDLAMFETVYGDNIKLNEHKNINDQYKSLLKLLFNAVNVSYFKLKSVYKEEGVEPVIYNLTKDFFSLSNKFLLATANDEIVLSSVYNKLIIAKYIDTI